VGQSDFVLNAYILWRLLEVRLGPLKVSLFGNLNRVWLMPMRHTVEHYTHTVVYIMSLFC